MIVEQLPHIFDIHCRFCNYKGELCRDYLPEDCLVRCPKCGSYYIEKENQDISVEKMADKVKSALERKDVTVEVTIGDNLPSIYHEKTTYYFKRNKTNAVAKETGEYLMDRGLK